MLIENNLDMQINDICIGRKYSVKKEIYQLYYQYQLDTKKCSIFKFYTKSNKFQYRKNKL